MADSPALSPAPRPGAGTSRAAVRQAWTDELRACLRLSWPLVLTNAIEMVMNLTNTAMIGRIGPFALAASSLGAALFIVCLLFGIGVTAAVSPLIARELGAGSAAPLLVRRTVQQGFAASVMVSGPIWALLWFAEPILLALGQEPPLAAAAAGYLHHLQWALLPALIYLVLRSMLAALERPRWAAVTGAGAIGVNALLNWVLIFGPYGLPALGLNGSGLATMISNIVMATALGLVVTFDRRFAVFRIFSGVWRPDWTGFSALWRLGLPIGITLVLESGLFSGATALMGLFDATWLAGHAIILQVASFTFMMPLGIAQAATVRVGRAVGAGDPAAVTRAGWTALALALAAATASALTMLAIPHPIIRLFIDPAEAGGAAVTDAAVVLLALAALFQLADAAQVVEAGMLRGLQDARAPMIIAAVGYWGIGLPVAGLLAFHTALGAPGVWVGLVAGLFAVAALLLMRWIRREPLGRTQALPPPLPAAA